MEIKKIWQIKPNGRRLKTVSTSFVNDDTSTIRRPSQKVSTLIKRGLMNGVKATDSLGVDSYDESEGRCPKAFRMDVDKFDIAQTMLSSGDQSKTISALLK